MLSRYALYLIFLVQKGRLLTVTQVCRVQVQINKYTGKMTET